MRIVPIMMAALATAVGLTACADDTEVTAPSNRASSQTSANASLAVVGSVLVAPQFESTCGSTFRATNGLTSPVAYYWRLTRGQVAGFALAAANDQVFFDAGAAGAERGVDVYSDSARMLRFQSVSPIRVPCIDATTRPIASQVFSLSHVCEFTWKGVSSSKQSLILDWAGGTGGSGRLGVPGASSRAAEIFFSATGAKSLVIRHRGRVIARGVLPVRPRKCSGPAFPTVSAQVVAGSSQSIVVGDTVAIQPRIRVTGPLGEVVTGAAVTAAVTSGYGFLTDSTGFTDASGEFALQRWELSEPGLHTLSFTVTGVPMTQLPLRLSASARNLVWRSQITPGENLSSIWGVSPSAMFSSGGYQTLNYFDGSTWTAAASLPSGNRYRVHGRSFTDVFSVGQGDVLRFDGATWSPSLSGVGETIGVWVAADGQAFVSGDGTFWRFDGATWTKVPTGLSEQFNVDRLENVWGSSPTNVYAVGRNGVVLRWDGNALQRLPTGFTAHANFVFGFGTSDLYISDLDGLLRFDGTAWTRMLSLPGVTPTGIWGTSSRNLYIGSAEGDIWRFDGRAWSRIASLGSSISQLFGFGPSSVYAAGLVSPGVVYTGS